MRQPDEIEKGRASDQRYLHFDYRLTWRFGRDRYLVLYVGKDYIPGSYRWESRYSAGQRTTLDRASFEKVLEYADSGKSIGP